MSDEVRTIDGQQVPGTVQNGTFYSEDGKLLVRPDGKVEHGFTDGQGYFHSGRTVDGQTVYGFDTDDGGWVSDDGKTAIGADGKVEHGITDPNTHQFLANGEVRTVDGHQVYGSVQNGTFYSEDGKLLVRPDGRVEHGFTDGQGYFHSGRTVDGQTVYGSDTDDGGWVSDDGKTAIGADGKVEHGITDPNTHQFLANGEVRTVDGHQVYGSVQ
ncbi:hypothetical protein, partial [Actinoallomurus rhizosphaericola]|uniref:hypothetical protein n=1 Tax=Actinoallomurus rhizosphaericola TaxID=2952536 RepID=UPI0020924BED